MKSDTVGRLFVVAAVMRLRLGGADYFYALLYSDPSADEAPVYRHREDHPVYSEQSALLAHLEQDGIPIDAEMAGSVDIDHARAVLGFRMSQAEIDEVINAWNALDDLTKALGVPLGFNGYLANRCYDKLFWGLNLESVTPPGERYVPAWQPQELAKIDQVLRECGMRVAPSDRIAKPSRRSGPTGSSRAVRGRYRSRALMSR